MLYVLVMKDPPEFKLTVIKFMCRNRHVYIFQLISFALSCIEYSLGVATLLSQTTEGATVIKVQQDVSLATSLSKLLFIHMLTISDKINTFS